ncbi:unnamed protein product [Mytilus edulis]|uniref:Uncharacterized protein n=1 Tax=Mytilus edulis TaxID=6550 RepID=A0A8S3UVQ0_MYTED|nr:unnamed protein product [Mytilus edulis]
MNKQIDEMLHHGIIKESNRDCASPVIMCKKKGGQLCFCCDYRLPNNVSLPRLEDVDSLGILSTFDIMNGYWHGSRNSSSSAFVTPEGVNQWTRMTFGKASAPASFQHLLPQVLNGLNYQIVFNSVC